MQQAKLEKFIKYTQQQQPAFNKQQQDAKQLQRPSSLYNEYTSVSQVVLLFQ